MAMIGEPRDYNTYRLIVYVRVGKDSRQGEKHVAKIVEKVLTERTPIGMTGHVKTCEVQEPTR